MAYQCDADSVQGKPLGLLLFWLFHINSGATLLAPPRAAATQPSRHGEEGDPDVVSCRPQRCYLAAMCRQSRFGRWGHTDVRDELEQA